MAKRLHGLLALFFQLALVGAITWREASSTARNTRISTTKASLVTRAASIVTRAPHFDAPSTYEAPHICGYVDYNSWNSYTCAGTNTCLWNSHLKVVGCGNPTSINYITSCVPHRSLQYCDEDCFANPSIIRCASEVPHCITPRIGPGGNYSILDCSSTYLHTPLKINLIYEGQTTIGHLPRWLGDDGNITYATRILDIVARTTESGISTYEATQTLFYELSSVGGGGNLPGTVVSGIKRTGEWEQGTSCTSDVGEEVGYVAQQRKKEIVAGSVIGSFMLLVVFVFVFGVLVAWMRKVRREKGLKSEECELKVVESSGEVRREERRTP